MLNIYKFIVIAIVGISNVPALSAQMSFYGPDSVRGTLKFETYFVTQATKSVKGESSPKTEKDLHKEAVAHTQYLFGVFAYQTYVDKNGEKYDYASASGATDNSPGKDLKIKSKSWFDKSKNLVRVDYKYEDRAVFHDDLWAEHDEIAWIELKFLMPTRPSTIYESARNLLRVDSPQPTPCTSAYDSSRAAFYYYWSHSWNSCPDAFQKYLHEVKAEFKPNPEDTKITPNYQRLIDQNKDGTLDATIMYGVDVNFTEKDLGTRGFREAVRKIQELKHPDGNPVFTERNPSEVLKRAYTFDLSSDLLGNTKLHLLLVDPDSEKFPDQARVAVGHDIFAYNGHSTDGDYFKLKNFFSGKRPRLNKDYQIFFIDSCSSYTFYHANLFQDKLGGSSSLHLILNVVGAPYLQDDVKGNEFNSPTLHLVTNLLLQTKHFARTGKGHTWKQHLDNFMDKLGFDYSGMPVFIGRDNK